MSDAKHLASRRAFPYGYRLDIAAGDYPLLSHLPPIIPMNCSGTVAFLFGDTAATGLLTPRGKPLLAHELWLHLASRRVALDDALPGDLLFFNPSRFRAADVMHVGIATGKEMIISACDRCGGVIEEPRHLQGHDWCIQSYAVAL